MDPSKGGSGKMSPMPSSLTRPCWDSQFFCFVIKYLMFTIYYSTAGHGMEWKTIFPYSILAIFFHSIPKIFHSIFHSILKFSSIFHSILKFSSMVHSILPYPRNFRLEAMQRIFCCFAPLQCCKQPLVKVCQQY